jgi:hypothetical protein
LTYAGKEESWIDGIIQSSRAADYAEGAAHRPLPSPGGKAFHDPRHAALLSRLLALSAQNAAPCIMFIACDGSDRASVPAMGTAQAAASLLGRSLLLDAWLGRRAGASHAPPDQPYGTPIPDAFMPRLYHRQLSHQAADIALLFGNARAEALAVLAAPFRYVAIEAPPPGTGPAANALAPLCLGTVLVVTAGQCGLDAIRNTASQITAAGGRIIGSVLADAPGGLPRWTRAV